MGIARELASVTWLGLRSVPARLGTSAVVVIGVAMVVAVFVSVFAMAVGFERVTAKSGHPDRVIILGGNGDSESASDIPREAVRTIGNIAGIKQNANGKQFLSAEAIAFVPLADRSTGLDASVVLRGIGPMGLAMRPEVRIVQGRSFRAGAREAIVGNAVNKRMAGANVGDSITLPDGDWQIVGVFASDGDTRESEMLADAETLLTAYRRQSFNTVALTLDNVVSFDRVKAAVASNPLLAVTVLREDVYVQQSTAIVYSLLRAIAFGIGGIMAFGAAFGALNTMYSSVSTRSAEIATLLAIGFQPFAVVTSVIIESLCLALVGAVIGVALAWLLFNGKAVSTLSGNAVSQVTFALELSASTVALGVAAACLIGLAGGLFPAVRAGSQRIVEAMRKV